MATIFFFFFDFLILKSSVGDGSRGWAGEWRVTKKPFSVLKSKDSVMYIVSPVFGEPWRIKSIGCMEFKCKLHSWICIHLENLKKEKLSQRRS